MPKMMVSCQRTVDQACVLEGTALHSGQPGWLRIEPAEPGSGLRFVTPSGEIPVHVDSVCEAVRCTSLRAEQARVQTVEHVLAALYAMGVDNAILRVRGEELPALDGSARMIVDALRRVGFRDFPEVPRSVVTVGEPICVEEKGATLVALPYEGFRVSVIVDFPEPVGREAVDVPDVWSSFAERLAPARTPGFVSEWESLKARGLALGAAEDNVLPIFPTGFGAPLRVQSEVASHKALDLIGDLALVGAELRAHVVSVRGGHSLNHALARAVLSAGRDRF